MELSFTKNNCTVNSNFVCCGVDGVDSLGSKLMWLTNYMVQEAAKVGKGLHPGEFGQEGELANEVGMRMLRVVLVVSLLWSIVPFCIGGCMRLITSLFRKDFVYLHRGQHSASEINALEITTFNTALMPGVGSVVNDVPPSEDRVDNIVKELIHRRDQIVCLQECFDTTYSQELVDGLKEEYPYIIHNVGPRNFGFGSGLTVASKVPIIAAQFEKFRDSAGDEVFANKGFLAVTLDVGAGRFVNLMTTHLQADVSSAEGSAIRERQIKQMTRAAKLYHERHPALCFLAVGDFNISSASSREWDHLTSEIDCFQDASSTLWEVGDLWRDDKPVNWRRQEGMQVDRIGVFRSMAGTASAVYSFADGMDGTSDHLALRSKITF